MNQRLNLVGISVRAAAESAVRRGWRVRAIDPFLDEDTLLAAHCSYRLSKFPDELASLTQADANPWVYTGGLENHPNLLETLAQSAPLWGASPQAVRLVRDPAWWGSLLLAAGHCVPAWRVPGRNEADDHSADPPGSWLVKPFRSGGGWGIHRHVPGTETPPGCFLQQELHGQTGSAAFLAKDDGILLLGTALQQVGHPTFGPFVLTGLATPFRLSEAQIQVVRSWGSRLATAAGLRGLFGIDFLKDATGQLWPLEINPRYTASMELHERKLGVSLLDLHAQAFAPQSGRKPVLCGPSGGWLPDSVSAWPAGWAKRTVFAKWDGQIPQTAWQTLAKALNQRIKAQFDWVTGEGSRRIEIADRPPPGAKFSRGEPLLTLIGPVAAPDDPGLTDALSMLEQAEQILERHLARPDIGSLTLDCQNKVAGS